MRNSHDHTIILVKRLTEVKFLITDKSGEVTTTLLLLGVWYQKESAGHKIMETFGFDDEKAKELEKHVSLSYQVLWFEHNAFLTNCVFFLISHQLLIKWSCLQVDEDAILTYR